MKKNNLGTAIHIACIAHENETDRGGHPYILHPLEVMNSVKGLGLKYMIVAVLHDVVEHGYSLDMLKLHFTKDITIAVDILTHKKEDTYEEYISLCRNNQYARAVKIADLKHNMDTARIDKPSDTDMKRLLKYHKAYKYLKYESKYE